MKDHITEQIFNTFFLTPDALSEEEKKNIEVHLEECALCNEHFTQLKEFYHSLEKSLDSPPTERDKAFAERMLTKKILSLPFKALDRKKEDVLDAYVEVIEPYSHPVSQRIIRYIQVHPLRFASGFSLAAALVIAALFMIRPISDSNPAAARIHDFKLSVYNKAGDVLWTKGALGIPDAGSGEGVESSIDVKKTLLSVVDIDGDGMNELLITGILQSPSFASDSLYCFEHDGKLRWKIGVGSMISFGEIGLHQHSTPVIIDFISFKRSPSEKLQLFILAHDRKFSPTKLYEVDPETGKELQSYFNRGQCGIITHSDIDGVGKEDIILGGINDGFNLACLSVLDPRHVEGYAPVPEQYLPVNHLISSGEKYYILFPITLIGKTLGNVSYNKIDQVDISQNGKLLITVSDVFHEDTSKIFGAGIVYTFGKSMKIEGAVGNDPYIRANELLLQSGKITKSLMPSSYDSLKHAIQYWDKEKARFAPFSELRHPIVRP